ncbi:outer membrane protein assembly factor BamE [Novosphingobium sp.]|uniref:outer membrane protein assembly factor BamE n=1 Tax=Novosphingobium sp. TaxID=1874826 RepID=UPI0025E7251B|nr:outer membrane protein assembly factor BamE [Novosphingobium sp.]
MQHRYRFLLGAVAVLALGACASIKDQRGYIVDPVLTDSIQPGIDNAQSVERTLGRPTFVSEFGRKDWYYVSINTRQKAFGRPQTKDQSVMRVSFDPAGNVAAVDRSGVDRVVRISPDGDKTPTLGRERSFLEDLFGNIGTVGAPGAGGGSGDNTGGPNGS